MHAVTLFIFIYNHTKLTWNIMHMFYYLSVHVSFLILLIITNPKIYLTVNSFFFLHYSPNFGLGLPP
jgi:hypothetical protein